MFLTTDRLRCFEPATWPPRSPGCYDSGMKPNAARVLADALSLTADERAEVAGQLLRSLDEDMSEEERQAVEAALAESEADIAAGRVRPASELLAELRGA